MKVEQLMTKEVGACRPDDTLNEAARIMWERDCGFVPVVESTRSPRVVGVLTDRDICMAAYTRGRALWEIRARDVMSTGVRACQASEDLATAESVMREAQIHRLPVLDSSQQLLGVISLADIAREARRETGSKRREVSASEVGEVLASIRQPRELEASGA